MDEITEVAAQAAQIIGRIQGVGEAEEETKGKSPVLRVNPINAELQRLGLAKENVLSTAEIAIGGKEAGVCMKG